MADLGSKRAVFKYVEDNPEWKKLELHLLDKQNAILWDGSGTKVNCTCKPGDKISLQSNKVKACGKGRAKSTYCLNVKVDGKRNQVGWLAANKISKPSQQNTNVMDAEERAMEDLDALLKSLLECRGPAEICTPVGTYKNACGVVKIKGTPKADFAIINHMKKEILWISHKKTGGPKAFQQYGGVTDRAGVKISAHKETQEFLTQTSGFVENNKLKTPTYKLVKDNNLIRMSVFGPDADRGSKDYGRDNCQVIGQGKALLTANEAKGINCWDLKWEHTVWNTDEGVATFTDDTSGYRAVFGATYRKDRGFTVLQKTYKGARVGVYPRALMQGRSEVILLEDA